MSANITIRRRNAVGFVSSVKYLANGIYSFPRQPLIPSAIEKEIIFFTSLIIISHSNKSFFNVFIIFSRHIQQKKWKTSRQYLSVVEYLSKEIVCLCMGDLYARTGFLDCKNNIFCKKAPLQSREDVALHKMKTQIRSQTTRNIHISAEKLGNIILFDAGFFVEKVRYIYV